MKYTPYKQLSKFYNYSTSDFQKATHINAQNKREMNRLPPIKNNTPPMKGKLILYLFPL